MKVRLTKRFVFAMLGGALGLGLCGALFFALDISSQEFWRMFKQAQWPEIIFVPLVSTIALVLTGAWKWVLIGRAFSTGKGGVKEQGFSFYFRHYLWQSWAGLFVPPSMAIIAGRGIAQRKEAGFKSGVLNGFWDQALEFAFFVAFVPAGLLYLLFEIGCVHLIAYGLLSQILCGALLCLVALFFAPALKLSLLPVLFLSSLRVILTIVRLVVCGVALGLALDSWKIAAATPVVSLLAVIPFTPGNLGIAEWGWTGVLTWAESNPVEVGLFAIAFRLLMMAAHTVLVSGYEAFILVSSKCK